MQANLPIYFENQRKSKQNTYIHIAIRNKTLTSIHLDI